MNKCAFERANKMTGNDQHHQGKETYYLENANGYLRAVEYVERGYILCVPKQGNTK